MPTLDAGGCLPDRAAVTVRGLDPEMMAALDRRARTGGSLQSILHVNVVETAPITDDLPWVGGSHQLLDDGLEFRPYFPFQPGTRYRALFDPPRDAIFQACRPLSLGICLPPKPCPTPQVLAIFPSGGEVPENLLRFYVVFSEPMRRGDAGTEIAILGPDGRPAPDVLYRAPVELWNPDMRYLTVLLDPGRLKRGVGPNRELGPPLTAGEEYTLLIGAGMTDRFGQRLPAAFSKRFRVTAAVRQPIAIGEWLVVTPKAGSVDPLELVFPAALDWAMLAHSISVAMADGRPVIGRPQQGREEKRWSFTPVGPWAPGDYRVRVSSQLEDVSGNDLLGPFDRDLRQGAVPVQPECTRSVLFHVS